MASNKVHLIFIYFLSLYLLSHWKVSSVLFTGFTQHLRTLPGTQQDLDKYLLNEWVKEWVNRSPKSLTGLLKALHAVCAKVQAVVFRVTHYWCSLDLKICLLLPVEFCLGGEWVRARGWLCALVWVCVLFFLSWSWHFPKTSPIVSHQASPPTAKPRLTMLLASCAVALSSISYWKDCSKTITTVLLLL